MSRNFSSSGLKGQQRKIRPTRRLLGGIWQDALITVGRFSDAEHAFDAGERAGDRLFAEDGRARILSIVGRHDEARARYLAIAQEFADMPGVEFPLAGAAGELRGMGRYDESIREFEALTQRLPNVAMLWTGLARTLMEAGRLNDASVTCRKAATTYKGTLRHASVRGPRSDMRAAS